MPEKSAIVGGNLITNPVGEKIEDEYIHIYPGVKMSIKMARSFADELYDLGYKPTERTDDRSVATDLPVNIMITDNELMISFYTHNFPEKMPSRLHNFVIDNLDKYVENILQTKVDVVSRVKFIGTVAIGEQTLVVHMIFDLTKLEKIGRKEKSIEDWFG